MLPLCRDQGIGVIPWSPLARGRLARGPDEKTERSETDKFGTYLYRKTVEADRAVIERVGEIAATRGVSRGQVALAWHFAKPAVTAPIVGATKIEQLNDAIAAVDVVLTAEELKRLEEPYVPHPVVGFV
jgi:aryl-alcohol dehydrogenase-like predicted oxidoreductase